MLRACIAFIAVVFAMASAPLAATPKAKGPAKNAPMLADPFTSPDAIQHWIKHYREKPNPQALPLAVKAMVRHGVFREIDSAGLYLGFVAGVVGSNPDTAEKLLDQMFPMPPEDQIVVVRAIAWSGRADWKELMGRYVERMPARRVVIERHMYGKLPVLKDLPLEDNALGLDALWGYYYATGWEFPIRRLVDHLDWSADTKDVDRLTAGNMIKLTLAINATRDIELMRILKAQARGLPPAKAKPLAEVIEAAETYETSKLRKNAVASISELKQKGSSTKRNASFWGQIGLTAFSLACVAAATMGQVEFGIPCVVGGATATAALKVFTLEK